MVLKGSKQPLKVIDKPYKKLRSETKVHFFVLELQKTIAFLKGKNVEDLKKHKVKISVRSGIACKSYTKDKERY